MTCKHCEVSKANFGPLARRSSCSRLSLLASEAPRQAAANSLKGVQEMTNISAAEGVCGAAATLTSPSTQRVGPAARAATRRASSAARRCACSLTASGAALAAAGSSLRLEPKREIRSGTSNTEA